MGEIRNTGGPWIEFPWCFEFELQAPRKLHRMGKGGLEAPGKLETPPMDSKHQGNLKHHLGGGGDLKYQELETPPGGDLKYQMLETPPGGDLKYQELETPPGGGLEVPGA